MASSQFYRKIANLKLPLAAIGATSPLQSALYRKFRQNNLLVADFDHAADLKVIGLGVVRPTSQW